MVKCRISRGVREYFSDFQYGMWSPKAKVPDAYENPTLAPHYLTAPRALSGAPLSGSKGSLSGQSDWGESRGMTTKLSRNSDFWHGVQSMKECFCRRLLLSF